MHVCVYIHKYIHKYLHTCTHVCVCIFTHTQFTKFGHLVLYYEIRRLEFFDLPKTISGKIRRVELRTREAQLHPGGPEGGTTGEHTEFADSDFPSLRGK